MAIMKEGLCMERIHEAREFLSKAIDGNLPFVLFSGGKDSLTVLVLAQEVCDELGAELQAIHVDTTVAIPDNLEYVRTICKRLGIRLNVVRPELTFFELALRKGFPTFRSRWCCDYLKLRPVRNFLRGKPDSRVVFDGVRAEESRARKNIRPREWKDYLGCYLYHPILRWSSRDTANYLRMKGLPLNPLYSKGFRRAAECWCGLYKSVEEFVLLSQHYPDLFEKLLQLEKSMRNGGSFLYQNRRRIYLQDLNAPTSQKNQVTSLSGGVGDQRGCRGFHSQSSLSRGKRSRHEAEDGSQDA